MKAWLRTTRCVWAGAAKLKSQEEGPTDLLAPLLPTAVGNDGRVDEGALGGHVLTQQALHFLRPEAGREVQQFHMPTVSNGTEIRHLPCQLGFSGNTTAVCVRRTVHPTANKLRERNCSDSAGQHECCTGWPGPSQDGAVTMQSEARLKPELHCAALCAGGQWQAGPDLGPMSVKCGEPSGCWEDSSCPTQVPSSPCSLLPAEHPHSKQKGSPDRSAPGPTCEGQQHRCFI